MLGWGVEGGLSMTPDPANNARATSCNAYQLDERSTITHSLQFALLSHKGVKVVPRQGKKKLVHPHSAFRCAAQFNLHAFQHTLLLRQQTAANASSCVRKKKKKTSTRLRVKLRDDKPPFTLHTAANTIPLRARTRTHHARLYGSSIPVSPLKTPGHRLQRMKIRCCWTIIFSFTTLRQHSTRALLLSLCSAVSQDGPIRLKRRSLWLTGVALMNSGCCLRSPSVSVRSEKGGL